MDQRLNSNHPPVGLSLPVSRRGVLRLGAAAGTAAAGVKLGRSASAAPRSSAPAFLRNRLQASGEIVASIKEGIKVQDPTLTGAMSDIAVNFQSYETLVDSPRPGEFTPVLAESWSNPDETTWEFKLRQGVQFHNGEPFNAEAVKVTMERWVNPDVGAPMGPILYPEGIIEDVVVVDEHTVQIKTARPFGAMLSSLLLTYMMPAQATADAGTGPIPENIGTGPFRVTEWVLADHITMEPFEGYWGEPAQVATLTYRHVTEDATRMAALLAGEIHVLSDISSDQQGQLANESDFAVVSQVTVESLYPVFNVTRPPFDDVRVRQAFNYGIDMQSIIEVLLGDGALRQVAPISPEVLAFNEGLTPYTYDPDKARALLQEAGYGDGAEVTFTVPGDRYPKGSDLAQTIAASAAELGFTVNVNVPEQTVGFESRRDLESWHIFQWGISAVNKDPDFPLRWFFHSSRGTGGTSYSDPELDRLLDEGASTIDLAQRIDLYQQAQAMIWEAAPALWQHHVVDLYAVNNRVSGLEMRSDKRASFHRASIQ